MDKEEALKTIVENFDEFLKKVHQREWSELRKDTVWFHTTNHADSYEVDEEWLGVTRDGKIAWAYASGCSCWDGEYHQDVCDDITMKNFTFEHEDMKEKWEEELIKFASL